MVEPLLRFPANQHGRDFAVGDVHGHFSRLSEALGRLGFDPERDRLFSVGDLVDRGPESHEALRWLALPWFHAVRGNHEDYVIRHRTVDVPNWIFNGGGWFQCLEDDARQAMADAVRALPYAMEIETAAGTIGIVHADCPVPDWQDLLAALGRRTARSHCLWSRERITARDETGVAGIRAVVCGHTPVPQVTVLGNVHHIDTGAWMPNGRFAFLDLNTLAVCQP